MINWLPRPEYPFVLLLIPLLWLLLWLLYRQNTTRYWQHRLPEQFHPFLVRTARPAKTPWLATALLILLACLALSAPSLSLPTSTKRPPPLIVVMELTPDMLAGDLPPSRLHQIQAKVAQLVRQQLPGHAALVVYAGSAHVLLPLSADPEMADNLIQAIHPSLMPKPGRNAATGIALALELLKDNATKQGHILLLTRQLDAQETKALYRLLRNTNHRLGVLGVGTPEGAPLPTAATNDLIHTKRLSKLDENSLQTFAKRAGAGYAPLVPGNQDLIRSGLFVKEPDGTLQTAGQRDVQNTGYWLLLPCLLLAALLFRRGWLVCLLLCCLAPPSPLQAGSMAVAPLQLIQQNPQQALQQLEDPLWLGIAAYHAGNYPLARDYFTHAEGAIASYNLGNSLMQLGEFAHAERAYSKALEQQPGLWQAAENLKLARQLQSQSAAAKLPAPGENIDSPETSQTTPTETKTATLPTTAADFQRESLDSWLQQIPDHPAALLKYRFQRELVEQATP